MTNYKFKPMRFFLLTLCLTLLTGATFAQDYRFGKVSTEELEQKQHPSDPSADAAILYREINSEFEYSPDKGWYVVTKYFERIKIYTKKGADEYANKTVNLYKGKEKDELRRLRGFTYNLNGGKINGTKLDSKGTFEDEVTKYLTQTRITMPDVQEGSVIEYRYDIESPFITDIDEFRFQEEIPIEKLNFVFAAPERFRFQTYHRGWLKLPVRSEVKDKQISMIVKEVNENPNTMGMDMRRVVSKNKRVDVPFTYYTLDMDKIPAIEEEPYVSNIKNYMAGIQFELSSADTGSGIRSYTSTWEDVSKTIYSSDAFGGELNRTNYFEKDLSRILDGATDAAEKASRIYSYVVEKMNWNRLVGVYTRDGVRKAYKENTGNVAEINLILTAMLRAANLEAYPVLVSTKSNGIPLFPTINGFNYVITAIELPQGVYLLDATDKNADMGVLETHVINGNGRVIFGENASDWIAVTSVIPAISQSMLSVDIDRDLKISGKGQQRFSGNFALSYRNIYRDLSSSGYKKELEKKFRGISVSDISFENLDKPSESVILKYDFEAPDGIEEAGGKIFLSPLLFLGFDENPFKSENRRLPIDFGLPHREQLIINFNIPEGYEIESVPENSMATLVGETGTFRYLISQTGNNLQVSVDFSINHSVIAESDYDSVKKFFEILVEKENEKVVFKKV